MIHLLTQMVLTLLLIFLGYPTRGFAAAHCGKLPAYRRDHLLSRGCAAVSDEVRRRIRKWFQNG